MLGAALSGMAMRVAGPAGYQPDAMVVDRVRGWGASVLVTEDPVQAVNGAHAVCTDVWTSMGQEAEQAVRRQAFSTFLVDEALLEHAADDAVFLHCLPAHRGEEVTAGVIDGPRSRTNTSAMPLPTARTISPEDADDLAAKARPHFGDANASQQVMKVLGCFATAYRCRAC